MTQVVLPKTNQAGPNEWSDVEDNDQAIAAVVNGDLDNDNLAADAAIALSKLAATVLQYVTAGKTVKVNFGVHKIADPGSDNSIEGDVEHGLEETPVVVLVTLKSAQFQTNVTAANYTKTKFTAWAYRTDGPSISEEEIAWLAIAVS